MAGGARRSNGWTPWRLKMGGNALLESNSNLKRRATAQQPIRTFIGQGILKKAAAAESFGLNGDDTFRV